MPQRTNEPVRPSLAEARRHDRGPISVSRHLPAGVLIEAAMVDGQAAVEPARPLGAAYVSDNTSPALQRFLEVATEVGADVQ